MQTRRLTQRYSELTARVARPLAPERNRLYAYPVELTWREPREDIEDGGHKGPELYNSIGRCSEKEHAER
jgi:hypothetical protein